MTKSKVKIKPHKGAIDLGRGLMVEPRNSKPRKKAPIKKRNSYEKAIEELTNWVRKT